MPEPRGVRRRPARAQSETIGIVLVFGLVILGATAVVVLGASALSDSEKGLSTQRAEKMLTQLDSKAALVALGNTDVQTVDFPRRETGEFGHERGSGWLNVTIQNTSSGAKTHIVNQSLGAVTYTNGGDRLAYQGGGVWRKSREGSGVMVSPPEFHFRNGTLTLPIINVTGERGIYGGVALEHDDTEDVFPLGNSRENPLDEHRVFVVVRSDYYEAWGAYFETRTDGVVKYDHANQQAILELVSPLGKQTLDAASSSRAASGTFELHGSAAVACGETVYSNSYDSTGTTDDYCAQTPGDQGDVIYGENVDISTGAGTSDIHGDLVSGDSVTVTASGGGGQPDVVGHINYTASCQPTLGDCQDRASETVNEIDGIDTMHNINMLISTKVDDVQGDNDNGAAPISGNALDFSANSPSDEVTLTNGSYYLDDVDMDADETLILDTSSGDVTIAVEGGILLDGGGSDGGTITVQGDGDAKFYVEGDDAVHGRTYDVVLRKNGEFVTPEDNATQLRLYGQDDLKVHLDAGGSNLAKFVGVIFSPPGRSGTAEVNIDGGEVYGGVLTGTTTIDDGSIHYDEALAHTQVISRDARVVKVTYLHVTVNRISVSNG